MGSADGSSHVVELIRLSNHHMVNVPYLSLPTIQRKTNKLYFATNVHHPPSIRSSTPPPPLLNLHLPTKEINQGSNQNKPPPFLQPTKPTHLLPNQPTFPSTPNPFHLPFYPTNHYSTHPPPYQPNNSTHPSNHKDDGLSNCGKLILLINCTIE